MHGKNRTMFLVVALTSATTMTSSQGDDASPQPTLFPEVMSEWLTSLSWSSPDSAELEPFNQFWDIPRTTCTPPSVLYYMPPTRLKKHKGSRHGNMPRHWRPGHNNVRLGPQTTFGGSGMNPRTLGFRRHVE